MKKLSYLSVVAVSGALFGLLPGVGQASAAPIPGGVTGTCGALPTQTYCEIGDDRFPGGTISVDVDLVRTFPFNYESTWVLHGLHGYTCKATFWADDPARSWVCNGVPGGIVELMVTKKQTVDTANLGLRW